MDSRLAAMVPAVILLLACRASPTPSRATSAPIENQAPATPAIDPCPRDLSWLGEARYLRYSLFEHGHFGEWRFHVDFYRLGEAATFEGVATGSYRQHSSTPVKTASKAIELRRADATKLLTTLRDGIRTRGKMREGQVVISDSSRSQVIAIEAMAFDPRIGFHPNFHVQFFVDNGETEPQGWNVRGCSYVQSLEIRRSLQITTDEFAKRLGNDAMLKQLMTP